MFTKKERFQKNWTYIWTYKNDVQNYNWTYIWTYKFQYVQFEDFRFWTYNFTYVHVHWTYNWTSIYINIYCVHTVVRTFLTGHGGDGVCPTCSSSG